MTEAQATDPGQLFDSAVQQHQAGSLSDAIDGYQRVLELDGGHEGALTNLASLLSRGGDKPGALALYERALAPGQGSAALYFNYANLLRELARIEDAERAYRRALEIDPALYPAAIRLAQICLGSQRQDDAAELFRTALHYDPGNIVAQTELGKICIERQDPVEAEQLLNAVLAVKPGHAPALNALGVLFNRLGRLDESLQLWRRAVAGAPDFAAAYNNLGASLRLRGKPQEALQPLREAVRLEPQDPVARCNLAHTLLNLGRITEAEKISRSVIARHPDQGDGYLMTGFALAYQSKVEAAIDEFMLAGKAVPDSSMPVSNALFCSLYSDQRSPSSIRAFHENYARRIEPAQQPFTSWSDDTRGSDRLKIGYLSPDFRAHPVSTFFEPVLVEHNRERVEVYCYSTTEAGDDTTARLRTHADVWRDCAGRDDIWLAEQIHADGIHILVDLAGHTAGNRARVLRARPAPVQAIYIGYPGSTGIPEVDYLIADARVCPESEALLYSENIARLASSFWCFKPPEHAPVPSPAPVHQNGHITFGSYNAAQKISASTVRLWTEVLRAVPDSRLLLKSLSFADEPVRTDFVQRFVDAGIAAERLEMLPPTTGEGFYNEYSRIDIALDPVPYNGGTTTCEALWQGVPVVALRGSLFCGRMGAAILDIVGRTELVAESVEEYVAIAAQLASDRASISELRSALRNDLRDSPLCNASTVCAELESAYHEMWQQRDQVGAINIGASVAALSG